MISLSLDELRIQYDRHTKELEALREKCEEKNAEITNLNSEVELLTRDKELLQREYEQILAQHEIADEIKVLSRNISVLENCIEHEINGAEKTENQLREFSINDISERERHNNFILTLKSMTSKLTSSLEAKLIVESPYHGQIKALNELEELTKSRESEVAVLTKVNRELEACLQIKKSRAEELEREASGKINLFMENKEMNLEKLERSLKDEIMTLESEINDITRVNQEQLLALQGSRTSKLLERDETVKTSGLNENSTDPASELTKRKDVLVKTLREIKEKFRIDADKFRKRDAELEAQIKKERLQAITFERENQRLEDTINALLLEIRKQTT